MKGFGICINDSEPIVTVSDNLVFIIMSLGYKKQEDKIYVGGIDSNGDHLIWLNKTLKLGDKIKVRVVENDKSSLWVERFPADREKMKQKYNELKRQLKEEGLL